MQIEKSIILLCGIVVTNFHFTIGQQQRIIGTSRVFEAQAEKTALVNFRAVVEKFLYADYMRDDNYLISWLRDQNLDVGKAKEKLLKSLQWRKANAVDAVVNEDFTDILRNCQYDLSGRDKEGRPFLTSSLAQCHLRRIVLSGKQEKLNRAAIHLLETMSAAKRAIEKNSTTSGVGRWVIIADMGGFSAREHVCLNCFSFFIHMYDIFFKNYPQLFKDIYVINANRITLTFAESLRAFVPINHDESFYAYGYNKAEWQKVLLQKIVPNQLPIAFGGTKSPKRI